MMNRFETVLRRVGARLELPHPARTRVLRELSSDLDDLYRAYRERGLDDDEAAARAARLLAPSSDSLEALERLHAPLYRRLLARFSHRTRNRAERVLLGGISAVVLSGGFLALAGADVLAGPSPWVAPVLALGAAVLVLGAAKIFLLYVKRDHSPSRLRTGLSALLALGCASVIVGVLGFLLDTYRFAEAVAGAVDRQFVLTMRWVRQDATLLALSLLVALAAGLAWFLCLRRVIAIEAAEASLYGSDRVPSGSSEPRRT
ncbi:MAG: hypothetical protein ACOC8B_00880 [Gemmatimonadota bacterium]